MPLRRKKRVEIFLVLWLSLSLTSSCINGNIDWAAGDNGGSGGGTGGTGSDGGEEEEETPTPTLTVTPATKTLASTRTVTFSTSGGTGPYTYTIVSGTGTINTGIYTPPAGGGTVAQIRATDVNGETGLATITVPASGSLDTTFNSTGIFTIGIGDQSRVKSLALQSDGKIVAAGYVFDSSISASEDVLVVRSNENGSLDNTFNSSGLAALDVSPLLGSPSNIDRANKVIVQSDGKILIGGYTTLLPGNRDSLLVRFNTNGTLDNSLGTNGIKSLEVSGSNLDDQINDFVIDGTGILAAGDAGDLQSLIRFTDSGALDITFGITSSGIHKLNLASPGSTSGRGIRRLSDNRIAVAATVENSGPVRNFALTVFNSSGTNIEATNQYDVGGVNKGDILAAFAASGGDNALLAGTTSQVEGTMLEADKDVTIVKVLGAAPALGLDPSFNGVGFQTRLVPSKGEMIHAIVEDTDGKILTAGYSDNDTKLEILRVLSTGTLDTNFGTGGSVTFPPNGFAHQVATALIIDSEGRIVVCGDSFVSTPDQQVFFARLWP